MADRFVEAEGDLAEREVMADLAIWPVSYMVSANTLEGALEQRVGPGTTRRSWPYLAPHGLPGDRDLPDPPPDQRPVEARPYAVANARTPASPRSGP